MPPGQSCCIVGCTNRSHCSKGEKLDNDLRFFRIPKVKTKEGKQVEEITTGRTRRRAWISAIRRKTITFESSSDGMRVCSRHFHSGNPAYYMRTSDPDWAPSLHMGHSEMKKTDLGRHKRQVGRTIKKVLEDRQSENIDQEEMASISSGDVAECVESERMSQSSKGTETTVSGADIDGMQIEINRLLEENRKLREEIGSKNMHASSFEGDNEKVKYYTGLASFATLAVLIRNLTPFLPQRRSLAPFQLLIATFLRLRLNLPVQHIAYMFQVHRTTIANAFVDTLNAMYSRLSPLVFWPDRDSLQTSMPHQFIEAFGTNVAVIIDCFEVFIEKPSNIMARAQTFSHYKHHHTIKYLIGITPQGAISFISNGWGGRTSDKHITEHSGFLNNLLPGDIVLADRGFDINDSVGMMCAEVKLPAFTKGKCQMNAKDVEETRKLAHLRIHVERVIGNVVAKYTILTGTIPINLVLPCEGEKLTFLDKIVTVCCALTNICPSVVQ